MTLIGLAEVISKEGFVNGEIKKGGKVRLVCGQGDEPFYERDMAVKAAGYGSTWGTIGVHYKLEYLYPHTE